MIEKATSPSRPSKPLRQVPLDSCDAHFHIFGESSKYELLSTRTEDPPRGGYDFWVQCLKTQMSILGFTRGVIVQSILYGNDNSIVIDTINQLGSSSFRGVGIVGSSVSDRELDDLRSAGIVGVRLNYVHGGELTWPGARALAARLKDREMHLQMLIHADKQLESLADDIRAMPVPVVMDHMGWPNTSVSNASSTKEHLESTLRLLGEGHIWVKLSGAFRFCADPFTGIEPVIRALVSANPDQCVWGSDWPYFMLGDASSPDAGHLLDAFFRAVTSDQDIEKILVHNPIRLYHF